MTSIKSILLASVLAATSTVAAANCTVVVRFASGSSVISDQVRALLSRVAQTHSANAMSIVGHTDAVGSAALNQRLSSARATRVEQALRSGGADQITSTQAVADATPQVSSAGAEALNRRVEIRVGNCTPALFGGAAPAVATPTGLVGTGGAAGAGAVAASALVAGALVLVGTSSTSGTSGTN